MAIQHVCEECRGVVAGDDLESFGDAYIAHARAEHDWPYPDVAIRNYAEATQRLSGRVARLPSIGAITVEPVTEARIDDWLAFFDHDAFADNPAWAACYCTEPHLLVRGAPPGSDPKPWQENRETMARLLRDGTSFGYLAYVDGAPAGWVNASRRSTYSLYREGDGAEPSDEAVIGISCFVIAPPYRRHGLAAALLDAVIADAPARGATVVDAYPFNREDATDGGNFHGPRSLFESRGFAPVEETERYTVVRKRVS